MNHWYETFFDALAHDVWRALVSAEQSDAEARLVLDRLRLAAVDRVLDIPSGDGRIALRLAAAGCAVTAVDLSLVAIERLAASPGVEAVHGDMRDVAALFAGAAPFGGAYCMGNSFGYLDDEATESFVQGLAQVLRPGARLLIDHLAAAEVVLRNDIEGRDVHERNGASLAIDTVYDARSSTLVGRMRLECAGESAVREVRHRVRTCGHVVALLERAGFAVIELIGDAGGSPFTMDSSQLYLLAERRE